MTGGCLCGAVRYESTGEPGFALLCHCRDCQRQSGSAFAAGWRVPAAGFRVTQGEPKLYVRAADSGNEITRAFCPECGTMLFLRVSARPDLVAIRVGTLDDPSGFRPEADIFVKSAQPWDYMNTAVPRYPTYLPRKSYEPEAAWLAQTQRQQKLKLNKRIIGKLFSLVQRVEIEIPGMPTNGHTSGLRLFESDETDTVERDRRRRMRGPFCARGKRRCCCRRRA